jgi:hypothetical protein
MPKDATKNIDRYKIRGGQLNEFDFHQNQEAFSEQQKTQADNLIPGTPPEAQKVTKSTKTNKAAKATKTASTKATKRATKSTKAVKARKSTKAKKSPVGATAKKLAARKAAKKK